MRNRQIALLCILLLISTDKVEYCVDEKGNFRNISPSFWNWKRWRLGGSAEKPSQATSTKCTKNFGWIPCLSSSWVKHERCQNSCTPRIYMGCSVCEHMTAWTQMTMGFSRIMKASIAKSHHWTGSHWCLFYILICLHLCLKHSPKYSRKLGAILGRAFEDCIVSESLFKLLYIFGKTLLTKPALIRWQNLFTVQCIVMKS